LAAIACAQGVRQVCPVETFASAPAGSDSNCTVVAAGEPNEKLGMLGMPAQPARLNPHAAMATVRFMIGSVYFCGPRPWLRCDDACYRKYIFRQIASAAQGPRAPPNANAAG
jgi:hypothetical protein